MPEVREVDVKDDSATQEMIDRVHASAKDGLESGELLSAFKKHVSPHCVMTGEVEEFQETGQRVYKIYLRLFDISGTTGDGGLVIWEDYFIIGKLD